MSSKVRQPFTPGGKFVVSKAFRFAGRPYKEGDEFPWRQLSCSVRKLRQLYEGRFLNNTYTKLEDLVEPEVAPTLEEPTVNEPKKFDEFLYDPDVHEIINPNRGEWYIADAEGDRLLRIQANEAKRLRKSLEPAIVNMEKVVEEE